MTSGTLTPRAPQAGVSQRSRFLIGVVLPLALMIAVGTVASRLILGTSLTEICHFTSNAWTRLSKLGERPASIRVSSTGTVWVSTTFPAALNRFENGVWRAYSAQDFGISKTAAIRDFTLDGERVLAVTSEGIILFDGQHWHLWHEALQTRKASSVVAVGEDFCAVDEDGNFSRFSGGTWRISRLQLPGVSWGRYAHPKLVSAGGSVWLVIQGVWRLDGANWQAVATGSVPKRARLAGLARGHIWVTDQNHVWELDPTGHLFGSYETHQLHLPDETGLLNVSGRGNRIVISGFEGLVESDGDGWRKLPMPGKPIRGILQTEIAPDGSIWVVGSIAQTGLTRLSARLIVIVIPLGSLAIIAGLIWYSAGARRKAREDRERTRDAVLHATGALPEDLRADATSSDLPRLAGTIGATLAISAPIIYVLRRRWPGTIPALAVVLVVFEVVHLIAKSLEPRHHKASDPINAGGLSKYDLRASILPILSGLVLLALYWTIRWAPANTGRVLFLVLLFGLPFGLQKLRIWMARMTDRATLQGRYDSALRTAPFVARSAAARALFRGDILADAGRYEEAESALREAIERAGTPIDRGMALEILAGVLMDRGRYSEAQRCLEGAINIFPERGKNQMIRAEMLLRQGVAAAEALACAERAVDLYGKSQSERRANPQRLGEILATKAWALAAVGRRSEALAALDQALTTEATKWNLTAAHVDYNGAMALHVLGDEAGAEKHLRKGCEVNPNGRWGKLCAAALTARVRTL